MSATHAHPPYIKLVVTAIAGLKNHLHGSSRQKIKKYIEENNKLKVNASAFRTAMNKALSEGLIVKTESGATFKLSTKGREGAKKKRTKKTTGPVVAAPTTKKAAPKTSTKKKAVASKKKAPATTKAKAPATKKKTAKKGKGKAKKTAEAKPTNGN